MCLSYFISKHLVLVYILAIQFLLIRKVSTLNVTNAYLNHKCLGGNEKINEEILKKLINMIMATNFQRGFGHTTLGETPHEVTIIHACRGDSYGRNCRSCFSTALAELQKRCDMHKGGTIWYDQCFIDVSGKRKKPFSTKIDFSNAFTLQNPNNMKGDIMTFNRNLLTFLNKLTMEASRNPTGENNEPPNLYYAHGEKMLGSQKVYAMVQCVKDTLNCKGCLEWSIKELLKRCSGKQGARVLSTTCNVRFELYPFLRSQKSVS